MKKIISVILAVIMAFAMVPAIAAFADTDISTVEAEALQQKKDDAIAKLTVLAEGIKDDQIRYEIIFDATDAIKSALTGEEVDAAMEAAQARINSQISYEYEVDYGGFFARLFMLIGKIIEVLRNLFSL